LSDCSTCADAVKVKAIKAVSKSFFIIICFKFSAKLRKIFMLSKRMLKYLKKENSPINLNSYYKFKKIIS
jgi:hypothetical protein